MRKIRGFSVIELLVVIGILSVLLAIGIPFYINYRPRIILNRAAAQLRGDLMMNRQNAVTTSDPYLFQCDPNSDSYELYRGPTSLGERSLPSGIRINRDNSLPDTLRFFPNGLTNGQGRLFLYHPGSKDTIRVIVTRAGFVRYEQR